VRENYGIYAIEAYRFYARTMARGSEVMSAMKSTEKKDFEAAKEAIDRMERMPSAEEILKCLRMVYCEAPDRELRRGEISERVSRASIMIPLSTSVIYANLKKARKLFAELRDLRV
jgi:hypothetical protein